LKHLAELKHLVDKDPHGPSNEKAELCVKILENLSLIKGYFQEVF